MFINSMEILDTNPLLGGLLMAITAGLFLLLCQGWQIFVLTKPVEQMNKEARHE